MAMGAVFATVPVFAAAVGVYCFNRNYKVQEIGGELGACAGNMLVKAKDEKKSSQTPNLAPQFDGLHCFEALVEVGH